MILLDTHALIWLVAEPQRLSRHASASIRSAYGADGIGIASITLWELAILFARGHMQATGTIESSVRLMVDRAHVVVKCITPEIAALATQFPDSYPADPADRLIGATARAEGLELVTRDQKIRESNLVRTIW
jgi:PIN domain nuclease of toxin-antitoxin system